MVFSGEERGGMGGAAVDLPIPYFWSNLRGPPTPGRLFFFMFDVSWFSSS